MKIRSGFVSNSSSSSFVMLGVRYDGDDRMDIMKTYDLTCTDEEDVIGINYFNIDDDDYEMCETEISLEEITKDCAKLKKIFGEDAKIKWFSGMRAC